MFSSFLIRDQSASSKYRVSRVSAISAMFVSAGHPSDRTWSTTLNFLSFIARLRYAKLTAGFSVLDESFLVLNSSSCFCFSQLKLALCCQWGSLAHLTTFDGIISIGTPWSLLTTARSYIIFHDEVNGMPKVLRMCEARSSFSWSDILLKLPERCCAQSLLVLFATYASTAEVAFAR